MSEHPTKMPSEEWQAGYAKGAMDCAGIVDRMDAMQAELSALSREAEARYARANMELEPPAEPVPAPVTRPETEDVWLKPEIVAFVREWCESDGEDYEPIEDPDDWDRRDRLEARLLAFVKRLHTEDLTRLTALEASLRQKDLELAALRESQATLASRAEQSGYVQGGEETLAKAREAVEEMRLQVIYVPGTFDAGWSDAVTHAIAALDRLTPERR